MKLSEMIALGKNTSSKVVATAMAQNNAQEEKRKLEEERLKKDTENKAILTSGAETLRVASAVNRQVQGVLDGTNPNKSQLPPVPAKNPGITEATGERVVAEESEEGNEDLDRQLREQHDLDKSLTKSNLVKRLKKLATMGATITFLAETPGTKSGRAAHVAMLKNFEVKKTQDDNYVVTGRDIEEEAKADIAAGVEVLKVEKERDTEHGAKFRSFRIDRIVRGSLNYSF